MKVSEHWLREWLDTDISTESICRRLTDAGIEVDSISEVGLATADVIVVDIRNTEPHPEQNALTICKVDDGTKMHRVVCGAPNVRAGIKSAFLRAGGKFPDGSTLTTRQFGEVTSNGMLCSEGELGISDNFDVIIELDSSCETGMTLNQAMSLEDVVIDFDITPDRGDCFSVKGLAREAAALFNLQFGSPRLDEVAITHTGELDIRSEDRQDCPRYLGRIILNINMMARTPNEIVRRLHAADIRTIDPIVDITNYVMLEMGQPLHAFDLDHVSGGIVVRRARQDERLKLLDETELVLTDDMLLITNANKPVALAGIMGGWDSAIQQNTRHVFLECAYFDPQCISRTSRELGIQTDASLRFERGVDWQLQEQAIERTTKLLTEVAGGQAGPITVCDHPEYLPGVEPISLSLRDLNRLTGENFQVEEVSNIFNRLAFDYDIDGATWRVSPPSHRFDITIAENLVEEVLRVHGLSRCQSTTPMRVGRLSRQSEKVHRSADIKLQLASQGFNEVITYSFTSLDLAQWFVEDDALLLQLKNPIAPERAIMRPTLITGLIETVRYNKARGVFSHRLFELGACFRRHEESDPIKQQETNLAALISGRENPESWLSDKSNRVSFYSLKGNLESLIAHSQVSIVYEQIETGYPFLHPGCSTRVFIEKKPVGIIGQLHPKLCRTMDIDPDTFVFEISTSHFDRAVNKTHQSLSPFPAVRRDLSLVVRDSVSAHAVEEVVKAELGDLLEDYTVFDVYRGEDIADEHHSIAIGITLRDRQETLSDDRVDTVIQKTVGSLREQLEITLRN